MLPTQVVSARRGKGAKGGGGNAISSLLRSRVPLWVVALAALQILLLCQLYGWLAAATPVAVPAVAADGLQGAPPWLSAKAKTEPETATAATTAVTAAFAADADAEQSGVDDALAGGSAARPAPAVKAEARVAEAGQADASAATSPHSGKRKSGDAGRKRTSTREEERTLRAPPAAVEGLGSKRRRREARSSTPWWVVSKGD